jgi:ADP-heptose:LPS heptosyltransferase
MLRRNVLIFQTGGLGDFILTWPFAIGLARIYPQSRIIYVTHSQKGELARRVLRLEATDVEAGWHGLYAESGLLPPAASAMLASAHAVYSFLPANPVWRENVERLSPLVKQVEIDARMPADCTDHITTRMLDSLLDCPPERAALEQILRSILARGVGYRPVGGVDVVIHPGAGSPAKCWPLNRFVDLVDELKKAGRTVRFVTGETERDRWAPADLATLAATAPHRQCNSLLELLGEIASAGAFIGNDSGPGHLAGMIGVPTLGLFGPTAPVNWGPIGPKVSYLRATPIENLPLDEVLKVALDL